MPRTDERELSAFGAYMRDLRLSRGFSQAAVARVGGLSSGHVGGIETGERGARPSRDMVLRIAKGLRASDAERDRLLELAGYVVRFGQGGRAEPRSTFGEVVTGDERLTSRQKDILLDLYSDFTGTPRAK